MRKKYNSKYGKFAILNKAFRESPIAPSAFSKIEDKEIVGKAVSAVGEKLIESPLHMATYAAVGMVYDKKKHTPYLGSILYTVFKWGLLLILAACPPILFLMVISGLLEKIMKVFR